MTFQDHYTFNEDILDLEIIDYPVGLVNEGYVQHFEDVYGTFAILVERHDDAHDRPFHLIDRVETYTDDRVVVVEKQQIVLDHRNQECTL
jgi:hypothetical protein